MAQRIKARKCKRRECRAEYQPKTEWQKFCSGKCRDIVSNEKKAALIKLAQKVLDAQESAA